MINRRRNAFTFSFASAALLGCGGGFGGVSGEDEPASDGSAFEREYVADENGVVLGTTWQALSYPNCVSAASDPDGDGWGWENDKSCIVVTGGSSGGSVGSSGGTTCTNHDGTASTMAALAVAAAMELKRWQPTKDFTIGKQGADEVLMLTTGGRARCSDGKCANIQALLDFQKSEASGVVKFPGNVSLNSSALRSRMVAKFREQVTCEAQPANGGASNCPVEEHSLTFQRSEKGGCDTNFFFVARKPDGEPLQYPAQLKNKLKWADTTNPYVGFQSVGEVVSIDPTFGLNPAGSTTTGTCAAACVKIGPASVVGQCCSCNGVTRSFGKAAWSPVTFICQ